MRQLRTFERGHLNHQMNSWLTQINQEDTSAAYLAMETNSGLKAPDYVALLAQTAWDRREEIAQALTGADFL